jgi:hypothetical protein
MVGLLMLNLIEDITPTDFRGLNSSHNLNTNPIEWDIDDELYDSAAYIYGKVNGVTLAQPELMINGSVTSQDYGGEFSYNTSTQAFSGSGVPLGIFNANDDTSFVAKLVILLKQGEGARVGIAQGSSDAGVGPVIRTKNGFNTSLVNTTISSLGLKEKNGANIDFYIRVYRWLRNAPINKGDMLFFGDVTVDKPINVDPLFNQSIGFVFQGTTKYDIDLNESEDTNEYNHVSIGNTNLNGHGNSSVIDRADDLAEVQTKHNFGWINDVENSKRSIGVIGGDYDGNPVNYKQKLAMSTELVVPINKIDIKANGSLSGNFSLQRNVIFPFEFMPMIPIARKEISAQDLSTAISLAITDTHYFAFVVRVMASAVALETLQCAINNDFTSSYFNHGQFNGASDISELSRAAKSYLTQCEIGDGSEANYMQFWVAGQKIDNEYTGQFHNLSNDGEYQFFKIEYHDSAAITSFDFKTTDVSSVTGVFEVFGIL